MPKRQTPSGDQLELDLEQGSAFDFLHDSAWVDYQTKLVFDSPEQTVRDYAEMLDRGGKAASLEQVLTLPIRATPWSIKPAKGDKGEAEWLTDTLTRPANAGGMSTPLRLVVDQMTAAVVTRRQYFEKVFTLSEGRVVYDKLAWRPPASCELARDPKTGAFRGFRQHSWDPDRVEAVLIPAHRAFVYLHGQHRDPLYGISDLRVAYHCFQLKQKILFLWYTYLDGQALPKTLVKDQDEAGAQANAKKVATLKSMGVLGLPKTVDVDTLESSGKGAGQFVEALKWLDQEAAQSVLAGFVDLAGSAASGTGSYALSQDQSAFFLQSRQAVAGEMADALTSWVLADLVRYNFGPRAAFPVFKFGRVRRDDAQHAFALLQSLASTHDASPVLVDELMVRVAQELDLDVDRVIGAVRSRRVDGAPPSVQVGAGIDQAVAQVSSGRG